MEMNSRRYGIITFLLATSCICLEAVSVDQNVSNEGREGWHQMIQLIEYRESQFNDIYCEAEYHDKYAPGVMLETEKGWFERIVDLEIYCRTDGSCRETRQEYRCNNEGDFEPYPHLAPYIKTWNAQKQMSLLKNEKASDCAVSIRDGKMRSARTPWSSIEFRGVKLSNALKEAQEKGRLNVEEPQASPANKNIVVVEFPGHYDEKILYKCWLDSTKLYIPLKIEERYEGRLTKTTNITPKNYEGVGWSIEEAHEQSFSRNGERTLIQDSQIKVKNIKTNLDMPDDLFEIKLLNGYRVSDLRNNMHIQYVVGAEEIVNGQLDQFIDAIKSDTYDELPKTSAYPKRSEVKEEIDSRNIKSKEYGTEGSNENTTEPETPEKLTKHIFWAFLAGSVLVFILLFFHRVSIKRASLMKSNASDRQEIP